MMYDDIVSHSSIRDCTNCEFNMSGICAGFHYGLTITEEMIKNSCDCPEWEMDFFSFCLLCSDIEKGEVV